MFAYASRLAGIAFVVVAQRFSGSNIHVRDVATSRTLSRIGGNTRIVIVPATPPPQHPLAHLGWDARWESARTGLGADLTPGRVVRVDRGLWSVLTERSLERVGLSGDLLGESGDDPLAAPCVGDWTLLRHWCDGRATLEHVLPRRTAVVCAQACGTSLGQPLVANIDVAAVVAALDEEPSITRVERLVSLAWESGAAPVVLLTKADVAADADEVAADVAVATPGVEVLVCSTVDGRGVDRLRALTGDGTVALLGSSGAGKSTLVNALAGAEILATRTVRGDGRGRHTSVRRELVVLPGGGCVMDTPGLRSVGLSAEGEWNQHTKEGRASRRIR